MSAPPMPAVLCIGLRSKARLGTIAPRIVMADGTVVVASSMPPGDAPLTTLAERVTYLAQVLPGPGIYDVEVVAEPATVEVPVVYPIPMDAPPPWALAILTQRGWEAP